MQIWEIYRCCDQFTDFTVGAFASLVNRRRPGELSLKPHSQRVIPFDRRGTDRSQSSENVSAEIDAGTFKQER
jgi:hypothetical protein